MLVVRCLYLLLLLPSLTDCVIESGASSSEKLETSTCREDWQNENPSFSSFEFAPGTHLLADQTNDQVSPLKLWAIDATEQDQEFTLAARFETTYFFYVHAGRAVYVNGGARLELPQRWYGAYRSGTLHAPTGAQVLVVEALNDPHRSRNEVGGPVPFDKGDLNYIDGCTDSLLVPSTLLGDPCLNGLNFPPSIHQTPHTHPSDRVGIVADGTGTCITPFGNAPLHEGQIFIIHRQTGASAPGLDGQSHPVGTHSFKTAPNETLVVVAYHPDSDFGPQHENHPMLNRTMIRGVSASDESREDYRTR